MSSSALPFWITASWCLFRAYILCVIWTFQCTCVHIFMESKGKCQVFFLGGSPPLFLRKGFSLNLKLIGWTKLPVQWISGTCQSLPDSPCPIPVMLGLQTHTAVPGFSCRFWGSELKSSNYVAGALPAESSPQAYHVFFVYLILKSFRNTNIRPGMVTHAFNPSL